MDEISSFLNEAKETALFEGRVAVLPVGARDGLLRVWDASSCLLGSNIVLLE